jgi:hypothetical protein
MCLATVMRFPHNVDEGFNEVVVWAGPATGIEKLPIIRFSKSERSPMLTVRAPKREPKLLSVVLEEGAEEEGGAR